MGEMDMRWDLLESQPPTGFGLTARLALPSRSSEVFIAVDSAQRRYVLVRVPDGEPNTIAERASRGIAVQTVEMKLDELGNGQVFVELACLEPSGYAAFDLVIVELIELVETGPNIGRIRLVQTVMAKWRKFWSGVTQSSLSWKQHLGLFGELWFLSRWLLPYIAREQAIPMWRGPIGARNDFETQGLGIEVKTSGKLDGAHVISGLEQLLVPPGVELYLFSIVVREEASGVESLPKLVSEIRGAIGQNAGVSLQFESMLAASDYNDSHSAEYDKVKFRVRGQGLYHVSPGFPRLIPEDIPAGLAPGVGNVKYEIRLDVAKKWLVGESPIAYAATLQEHLKQSS
jgi:hypothetical protein